VTYMRFAYSHATYALECDDCGAIKLVRGAPGETGGVDGWFITAKDRHACPLCVSAIEVRLRRERDVRRRHDAARILASAA